jgi:asparagine synthetase A
MPKTKLSHKLSQAKDKDKIQHGWEVVISDAEKKLQSLKQHEAALRAAIRLFKKNLEQRVPLPDGLTSTQT